MVVPGAELTPGFGLLTATHKDGTAIGGMIVKQSKGRYTVKDQTGKTIDVRTSEVRDLHLSSPMPPMGLLLKPREIRDVIEYLSTLK